MAPELLRHEFWDEAAPLSTRPPALAQGERMIPVDGPVLRSILFRLQKRRALANYFPSSSLASAAQAALNARRVWTGLDVWPQLRHCLPSRLGKAAGPELDRV